MPIYFTFVKNNNKYKYVFLNSDCLTAMIKYKYAFLACLNLAYYFTGCLYFKVETVLFEEFAIFNLNCYGKELLSFKVDFDNITLFRKYKDTHDTYTFVYDFDDRLHLALTDMILKSENIMQAFRRHEITLTKVCGNRIFRLCIPIDVKETISRDLLSSLHEESNLRDLERVYFKHFYPNQQTYDKREETILEIHDIEPDDIKIAEVLTIRNGEEESYKVSEERTNLHLTLLKESTNENSQITFSYNAPEPNIDVNSLIKKLQEKSNAFHSKPFLRLLKPEN